MDKLSLRVYLFGSIAAFASALRDAALPDLTTCDVVAPQNAKVADDSDTVVITDDASQVRTLAEMPGHNAVLIFVGSYAELMRELGSVPPQVADIWAPGGTADEYTYRLERLIAGLRERFDAWLYRTWLMSLIDSLPDIIWFKERSGLHNLVNLSFCDTVHKSREDTKDKGHCYIWNAPPESEYQCAETDNAVMGGGHLVVADELVETDRGMRQFRTYKSPVRGRTGDIIGTVGLGHDVTDFTNMGMELQILVDNLPYPVAIADNGGRLTNANARFREAFGMGEEQVVGLDYLAWKNSLETEDIERVEPDGSRHRVRDLVFHQGDERYVYEVSEPQIRDYFGNASGHYCLFRDVTVERAYERQTVEFANTDALTGLSNRRRFHRYLEDHAGEPMSLLNLDLDNFKPVNDTYGHATGDEVLMRIARIIAEVAGDGEQCLVSRQGGDEFACAFVGKRDVAWLEDLADRIHGRIHDDFASLNVDLGCSVGIARTDALAGDPDAFLREADERMYADKQRHHGA